MESVRHEESARRWWGLIRQQNLGVLRGLDCPGGLKRRRRRSEVGWIPGGSLLSRTSAGRYFIPNTSPPTSEFEFRMKYREIFAAEVVPLNPVHDYPQISWHLMCACQSLFPIRAIRRVLSKFSPERSPKRHTIMVPPAVSLTPR